MDLLGIITASLAGGATLGGIVMGFLSSRRGAEVKLKDAIINDYKTRVEQLESAKDTAIKERDEARTRVVELENERQLPLTQLTELIMSQHTEQIASVSKLSTNIAKAVRVMAKSVKAMTTKGVNK